MTIAKRLAREAHDRENPWRPMSEAKPDGTVCELLLNDMVGCFDTEQHRYFLDHDGRWYRISPPGRLCHRPVNWRPAFAKLSLERRHFIKKSSGRMAR